MKLAYHDHYQCICGEIFMVLVPIYICIFKSELAMQADRQYQFAILRHTIAHMEDRFYRQAERKQVRSLGRGKSEI